MLLQNAASAADAAFQVLTWCLFLVVLAVGTYTDLKRREVPDWLNYGLIFAGFAVRAVFASAEWNVWYLLEGLFGFLAMLALAYLLFLSGQMGGGDAKLLMGAGSLLGLRDIQSLLIGFVANLFIMGALFGFLFSLYLMQQHWQKFKKTFHGMIHDEKTARLRRFGAIVCIILFVLAVLSSNIMLRLFFLFCILFYYLCLYLYHFVKCIESVAMLKRIPPEHLTPGDWIPENMVIDGKRVAGPKDLGISEKQIRQLITLRKRNKIKTVLVKEGIPFVPSFLLSFIVTLLFGNLLHYII